MASPHHGHSGETSAGPAGQHREHGLTLCGLGLTVNLTRTLQKCFQDLQTALQTLGILSDPQVQLWVRPLVAAVNSSYQDWTPHIKRSLGSTLRNVCTGLSRYTQANPDAAVQFLVCLFCRLYLYAPPNADLDILAMHYIPHQNCAQTHSDHFARRRVRPGLTIHFEVVPPAGKVY